MLEFEVIDNLTGNAPDCEKIALTEEWAKHLIYCDIDCFAITEDGDLILIDDCNNIAYPPSDRFTVKFDPESIWIDEDVRWFRGKPESLRPKGRWIEHEYADCFRVSNTADHLLTNGVTVQQWIPVTERLPEDNKEVLVYCGSYREMAWYESDNKSWLSNFLGCCTDDITHWMPLPEPPKGE